MKCASLMRKALSLIWMHDLLYNVSKYCPRLSRWLCLTLWSRRASSTARLISAGFFLRLVKAFLVSGVVAAASRRCIAA